MCPSGYHHSHKITLERRKAAILVVEKERGGPASGVLQGEGGKRTFSFRDETERGHKVIFLEGAKKDQASLSGVKKLEELGR